MFVLRSTATAYAALQTHPQCAIILEIVDVALLHCWAARCGWLCAVDAFGVVEFWRFGPLANVIQVDGTLDVQTATLHAAATVISIVA